MSFVTTSALKLRLRGLHLLMLALVASLAAPRAEARKPAPLPDHWVSTWSTANFANENKGGPDGVRIGAADSTYRQIVHISLGGPLLRIELSNEFGTEPLSIAAAHVAVSEGAGAISLPSANALTFAGSPAAVIPPGGVAISDPFALSVPAFSNLAISFMLPAQTISHVSWHGSAFSTGYRAAGDLTGQRVLDRASAVDTLSSWYFLKSVDVKVAGGDGTVVAFGDSITDGAHSTPDANHRWTDVLAARLLADKKTHHLALVNEGIGGNKLLEDGTGPNALARFDRDVLEQAGARYVLILEGINDLGHGPNATNLPPVAGMPPRDLAQAIIAALTTLTERAHTRGLIVYLATITPYQGAGYFTPEGEAARKTVNAWIRSSKLIDGFLDFDEATRDPHSPDALRPSADSGDHLHPGDAGYKAMGDSVNLKLFETK